MTILWRDSMKIGDLAMDADHKQLITLLNRTEDLLQQQDLAPSTAIFEELQVYVESHFPAEEAYMEQVGYPGLEEHRQQHEALAYRFYVLLGRFRASVDDAERRRHVTKLAEFLREWFAEHILKEVLELKPAMPAQGAAKPATTQWLMPFAGLGQQAQSSGTAAGAPPAAPQAQPAPAVPAATAPSPTLATGEWSSLGALPPHLEKYVQPPDYTIPRPPPPILEFPSFQALCEAAIWRWVNKVLLFFQRHNDGIVRELPPIFVASPEFARNLKRVLDVFIFPNMWESRRMRMLLTNFDRSMADDESFFTKLGPRNTEHILTVWGQTWSSLRLVEGTGDSGGNVMKIKDETKMIRDMLQPSSKSVYDIPKVGNREIEIFKSMLDPESDWWQQFNRRWKPCNDYYLQEKTPLGDPDIREGTLRDHLLEIFNSLPEPWGDFLILTAHRVFPRLDSFFLENFTTNFGRSEAQREAVMPYTIRYLRQVKADPEVRARELRDEEDWQAAIAELRTYRKWRSFGGFM